MIHHHHHRRRSRPKLNLIRQRAINQSQLQLWNGCFRFLFRHLWGNFRPKLRKLLPSISEVRMMAFCLLTRVIRCVFSV